MITLEQYIITSVVAFIIGIVLTRLLGAWLFKIDEVIILLRTIKEMLKIKLTDEELEQLKRRGKK